MYLHNVDICMVHIHDTPTPTDDNIDMLSCMHANVYLHAFITQYVGRHIAYSRQYIKYTVMVVL